MAMQPALTLIDAIAEGATNIGLAAPDDALRAQAALVRSLVDEVGRRHPSERQVAALHAQLGEELSRLAELVPGWSTRAGPGAAGGPIDVLIVEDDEPTLRAAAIVVRDLGYPCRTANSAEAALLEYKRRPAAIVITDLSMPGMSGLDLCRTLKDRDPHAYVILVTAFHDDARLLEGVRRSVDDFLPKPIDIEALADRLRAGERLVRGVRMVENVKGRLGVCSNRTVSDAGQA
jgi:CheY-like chemotaxis protein